MKGDFSRLTHNPLRHFTSVLLQQGRVLTDADFNEQAAIQQDYLRALVVDLMGKRWRVGDGFALSGGDDVVIAPGHAYLGGLLCVNDESCARRTQPFPPEPSPDDQTNGIAFLEAVERTVSAAEDATLLEPALDGVDTSVRGQVVWQVRRLGASGAATLAEPVASALKQRAAAGDKSARDVLKALTAATKAFARKPIDCSAADKLFDLLDSARPRLAVRSPNGYQGTENSFYRIEIHDTGSAGTASFKWSRNNGGTVFAVLRLDIGANNCVATLAAHDLSALQQGGWVELSDDAGTFRAPAPLLRIARVDAQNNRVTLQGTPPGAIGNGAVLRLWDGATSVLSEGSWISLDAGIELRFTPSGSFNSGDYWNFAARPSIGAVMWPVDAQGQPRPSKPFGPCRHRAALASLTKKGRAWQVRNYRPRR